MTDIIVKVMVEVLFILALVTREVKQGKISKFILNDLLSSLSSSNLSFFRKVSEKVGRKVGHRGYLAKARHTNARGRSDGGCTRSKGHAWRR